MSFVDVLLCPDEQEVEMDVLAEENRGEEEGGDVEPDRGR